MKSITANLMLFPISEAISANGDSYATIFMEIDSRILMHMLESNEQRMFQFLDNLASIHDSSVRFETIRALPDFDRLFLRIMLVIADMQHDTRYFEIQYSSQKDLNRKIFLFLKNSYIECKEYHNQTGMDMLSNVKNHVELIRSFF